LANTKLRLWLGEHGRGALRAELSGRWLVLMWLVRAGFTVCRRRQPMVHTTYGRHVWRRVRGVAGWRQKSHTVRRVGGWQREKKDKSGKKVISLKKYENYQEVD
jgi:hypothetical protein